MSSKAQLQAVIDGYREELAVTRIQHNKELAEVNEKLVVARMRNVQLDAEADRQEERIMELEARLEAHHSFNTAAMAPMTAMVSATLCFEGAVAITTVAQMLEHRAENMGIKVGSDAGEYSRLVERAHNLRTIVRQTSDFAPNLDQDAAELFESLSTPF